MNDIIKKNEVLKFVAFSENQIIKCNGIGNEIIFPFTKKQFIEINDGYKLRFFDNIDETSFQLSEAIFKSNNEDLEILYEIGEKFNLEKIFHRRGSFSYQFKTQKSYDSYLINFKKYGDNYFCILYSIRRERVSIYGGGYVFRECTLCSRYLESRTFRRI